MKNMKKTIVTLLVTIVVMVTFYSEYIILIKDIENTAKSREAQINRHIDLSKGFIDLMTIYGNDFFRHSLIPNSELFSLLENDSSQNSYHLDAVGGTKYQKAAGNLTGIGSIPRSGIDRDEINLALQFNQHFSSVYSKLPDIAWLYYTSENEFINIYPWVSSKDFAYKKDLKTEKFYEYAMPENNPIRISVWTPVYLDHAGKGLMVTLSSPIYNGDTFMGAVSLDFTNEKLCEMINSDYEIYIVDDEDSVIANSLNIKLNDQVPKFNTLLKSTQSDVDEMKELRSNTVQRLNNYYIYTIRFINAPWRMFVRVPVWLIAGKAMLFTLPILIICLLLLLTLFEVEKRRNTETLLTNSLKELTSYQKLLEKAAKYDFLTSTVNRRGLMDIFNQYLSLNNKTKTSILFIMGDIDYFKKFNDAFGHAAGDKVLKEIAAIMQKNIKKDDVVCRWGGEEFIIMLLGSTYEDAMLIADNIRMEIQSTVIPWENSSALRATMTFGVAEYDNSESLPSSVSKADSALYIGKNKGRNQVVGYRDCQ